MTAAAVVRRPAATAAGAVFGGLARLRHRRSLHPDGASYEAVVRIDGDEEYAEVPLLARPGEYRAVLRFSRGLGLPASLPAALADSFRFCRTNREVRLQAVLMTTSARPPVVRHR